jgi:uncharacterized protein
MRSPARIALFAAVICALSSVRAPAATDPQTPEPVSFSRDAPPGTDVIELGRRWLAGEQVARSALEDLAAKGRSDAQEMLGEIMGGGPPALRDEATACGWHAKAAAERSDALHNQARCHEKGTGAPRDLARAAALYRQAADRGYVRSMCALGNLYLAGRGVEKDEARGVALCRQAAERGEPNAQTDLGNLYLQGIGVAKDMVQARRWYELASAQGQPNAQFVLGQIYWNGDGVARSREKAAQHLKDAYKGGRRDAAPLLAK